MTFIRQLLLSVGAVFLKPSENGGGREMAVTFMLWGKDWPSDFRKFFIKLVCSSYVKGVRTYKQSVNFILYQFAVLNFSGPIELTQELYSFDGSGWDSKVNPEMAFGLNHHCLIESVLKM